MPLGRLYARAVPHDGGFGPPSRDETRDSERYDSREKHVPPRGGNFVHRIVHDRRSWSRLTRPEKDTSHTPQGPTLVISLFMIKIKYVAVAILGVMFLLMLGSAWNDSAIMDELAHIPAGFGYLQGDYRLNPEHPPLLKTLAAFSAKILVNPNFPTHTKAWTDDVNGQWDQGSAFLYESQNDADKIIFWARFPLMLLTILLGWLLFSWTQKRFGRRAALLTLIFFAFSPTVLAHGRFVTTDVGATFGFFIGIISFLNFIEKPSGKNIFIAGLAFGTAELLKFSLVLLVPLYAVLWLAWVWVRPNLNSRERLLLAWRLGLKILLIELIGIFLIWGVYAWHVWNYPPERQYRDTGFLLESYPLRQAADFDLTLIKNPLTRPLGQYMLGVLMVNQRATGGNTQFFLGDISSSGFRSYFPLLYLLKEPLAFHILSLIAFVLAILRLSRRETSGFKLSLQKIRSWIASHFAEFAALFFIIFYWALSIASPLNIGIRHVLPTFPFIFILVARQLAEWIQSGISSNPQNSRQWLHNLYRIYIRSLPKRLLVTLLILWLSVSTYVSFPYFLSYYNELGKGIENGYKIAVDSNYDWGQDLKRLGDYVRENNIEHIAVDYFGGGQPKYYLGDKYETWQSSRGPASGWFAISATFRQSAFGRPVAGFVKKPEDSYEWLRSLEPVARIGYSIFLYKLP